jgi:putative hydrolase of the HAD superfamily
MEIKSVIFDFGNVICFPPDPARIAVAAEDCGVPTDIFLRALWADRLAYDAGMEPREYWRGVGMKAGRAMDDALIPRMIEHEIGFWSRFDDRVFQWIDQLRAGGLRVGILSNLPIPLGERLREIPGFLDHFDHVTFSYELRVVKPQAAIYEDSIRGLETRPDQALFIDDRPENVEGARAVGMHAEVFDTWETFVETTPERYRLPAPTSAEARRQ